MNETLITRTSIDALPYRTPFGRVTSIALDSQMADNRSKVSSGIGMPTIPNITRRNTAIYPYKWMHANAVFIISFFAQLACNVQDTRVAFLVRQLQKWVNGNVCGMSGGTSILGCGEGLDGVRHSPQRDRESAPCTVSKQCQLNGLLGLQRPKHLGILLAALHVLPINRDEDIAPARQQRNGMPSMPRLPFKPILLLEHDPSRHAQE